MSAKKLFDKFHLVNNPATAWRKYGEEYPYFGVLTDERFRRKNLTVESLKEFFVSSDRHTSRVLTALRDHAITALSMDSALDFGGGVGRIVIPLARRFKRVIGIDISEAYRSEALSNCLCENIGNPRFLDTLHQLRDEREQFDLVHSSIVFNHIPWSRGQEMIQDMFELLKPNGAMAVQVMVHLHVTSLRRLGRWLRQKFLPFNWLVNTMHKRPIFEPLRQGTNTPSEICPCS